VNTGGAILVTKMDTCRPVSLTAALLRRRAERTLEGQVAELGGTVREQRIESHDSLLRSGAVCCVALMVPLSVALPVSP
jgi:hypothetical protein